MNNPYRQPGRPRRPQPPPPGAAEQTVPLRAQPQGPVQVAAGPGAEWRPPRKRRTVDLWVLSIVIVFVAAVWVGALGFIYPGWFVRTVFDAGSVELGVQQILRDNYGVTGIESVTCPPGEPVQPAETFACKVRVDGRTQTVTVSVPDSNGTYEVSRPR